MIEIKNTYRNPLFTGSSPSYIPVGEVGKCRKDLADEYIRLKYAELAETEKAPPRRIAKKKVVVSDPSKIKRAGDE